MTVTPTATFESPGCASVAPDGPAHTSSLAGGTAPPSVVGVRRTARSSPIHQPGPSIGAVSPRFLATLLAIAVLAVAGLASATSALYLTDVEQARQSTAVVLASVGTVTPAAHPTYRIVTHTTIKVDEVLLGNAPAELKIEQIGGTLNGVTVFVPGDAVLEPGEKVVLFLRQVDGGWYLTAMEQSRYQLRKQGRLGTTMHRELHTGLYKRDEQGRLVEFTEAPDRPVKLLSSFRTKMTALAAEGAK